MWLGAGAAMTAGAHQYDGDAQDYFRERPMNESASDFGNQVWGDGLFQAGLAASIMMTGYAAGDPQTSDLGETLAEALIIQGITVNLIKPVAGRERPNGENDLSFPSGHTSTAFCTAAVLHDRLGLWAGLPAYALAAMTGAARIDDEAHYLSDVVMGAAIGAVTGYAVSRSRDDRPFRPRPGVKPVAVVPFYSPQGRGLALVVPL